MTRNRTFLIALSMLAGAAIVGCAKSGNDASSATAQSPSAANSGASPTREVAAAGANATHGKAIYATNCTSCHGAAGAGGGIGPTLKGEKSRKDQAATVAWIKNPQPPMPKLYPSPLSAADVNDVAAYVQSLWLG